MTPYPPKLPLRLLRWFCHPSLHSYIEGDLLELHDERATILGKQKANFKLFIDVLLLFRPGIIRPMGGYYQLNQWGMFKNYFKTTIRTFIKNPLITSVSIFSLIVGLLCFQLIYVWVKNEISTNLFHKNIDNIYVSMIKRNPMSDYRPTSFGSSVNYEDFIHIKNKLTLIILDEDQAKVVINKREFAGKGLVVDSTFFELFDFPLLNNESQKDILKEPTNIILSQEFSNKLFGDDDPIGKLVEVHSEVMITYQVAGILKSIPSNSSIYFDFLVPMHSQKIWSEAYFEFFLTDKYFDEEAFKTKIAKNLRSNNRYTESTLSCIPLKSIYFDSPFGHHKLFSKYGNINNVKTMAIVGLVLILISALSFGNLQTILQITKTKSIGIKQASGASKFDLSMEMIMGKVCFLLIAVAISYLFFELIFPYYSSILKVDIDRNRLTELIEISVVAVIVVCISLPFSLIQIYNIVVSKAIRGQLKVGSAAKAQRILTTLQYGVTIVLIISTLIVFHQVQYMSEKDIGISQNSIVSFKSMVGDIPRNQPYEERDKAREEQNNGFNYFINELTRNHNIINVSQGDLPVNTTAYPTPWSYMGSEQDYTSENTMTVDTQYADLLDIELVEGRFFNDSLDKPTFKRVVINEAAQKYWNITDISNAVIKNKSWGSYEVIGVVKDYHYEDLSNEIAPLLLLYIPRKKSDFIVKIREGKEKECLAYIESVYNKVNPNKTFDYVFLEDEIQAQYVNEKRVTKVFVSFSVIAIILSSISLLTFALYETKRRTKEIGIRKVNGADLKDVLSILILSFLKPIGIAYCIACPIAWYMTQAWLSNFANRIDIGFGTFGIAAIIIVTTAIVAVCWQSLEVSRKKTVESLRYE